MLSPPMAPLPVSATFYQQSVASRYVFQTPFKEIDAALYRAPIR